MVLWLLHTACFDCEILLQSKLSAFVAFIARVRFIKYKTAHEGRPIGKMAA
jgi:hypothetical protein